MLVLRIVVLLAAIALATSVVLYFVTRDRRWLRIAWRLFQATLAVVLIVLSLFFFERLLVLV